MFLFCCMPAGYQIEDQDQMHYVTLDVAGSAGIFSESIYKDIILESLKYCRQYKHLGIYAYVIMSDQIHLLVKSSNGNLSGALRDFKSLAGTWILQEIEERKLAGSAAAIPVHNSTHQLWKYENRAIEINSYELLEQQLDHIHNYPVRAGLVSYPEDYMYSSAPNYAGLDGLLEVELVGGLLKNRREVMYAENAGLKNFPKRQHARERIRPGKGIRRE